MSHVAIAAALALGDVSAGERLVAFSLASYANREHRAWPGTPVAAARAGLSRSQYLAARDSLEKRGLVVIEEQGSGRGNSPLVALVFAHAGPWLEGQINAGLFEAVLGHSRSKGSARLLLGALAALADDELGVAGRTTEEIRAAAGMADRTYRRARAALLACGELVLETAGGGRSKTNYWLLCDPRVANPCPALAPRTRIAPSRTARPLIATAKPPPAVDAADVSVRDASRESLKGPGLTGVSATNPGQIRTVYAGKGPGLTGFSQQNPGQNRTVSTETPAQTPAQTPAPNARAGREPQNLRTCPPSPPDGGSGEQWVTIVEDYVTERGRRRQRTVTVELAAIRAEFTEPSAADHADWEQLRSEGRLVLGDSVFELWLASTELAATDAAGCLVLACPSDIRSWVAERYAPVLERVSQSVGRQLRVASDRERQLLQALTALPHDDSAAHPTPPFPHPMTHHHKEAV